MVKTNVVAEIIWRHMKYNLTIKEILQSDTALKFQPQMYENVVVDMTLIIIRQAHFIPV